MQGAYNAVWVKGAYGDDTFYYGRGAGALPTGVAVVSDLMRVAREIRSGSPERVSPFAHERLGEYRPVSVALQNARATICVSASRTGRASWRRFPVYWLRNTSVWTPCCNCPLEPSATCRSSSP